jgi:predicted 2-oxoglutarate/Fe(II)-dependent dioxygenase YbiX
MSARDDKIRQLVAELDVHIGEVEARVADLKSLLAEDEVPGRDDPS